VVCAVVLFIFFLCLKDKTAQEHETQNEKNENCQVCEMHEKNEKTIKPAILDKQKLIYIAVMALFLFCNSYFKTLAAGRLSAVQLYPLSQGAAMILSLLMSAIFFKEKIKPLCIVGMAVLFIGLLFLNVFVF
jgi:multidrug transporter EmrE-like cation transporter